MHGQLCPGKIANQLIFTRRDVKRWRKERGESEREVAITRELMKGTHPLDIYLEANGRYSLDQVAAVMLRWAKLSGKWVIEGPRGSYARWLQRLGLVTINPRMLRRLVEAMLADSYVQRLIADRLGQFQVGNGAESAARQESAHTLLSHAAATAPASAPSE